MITELQPEAVIEPQQKAVAIKVFGVGTAGVKLLDRMATAGWSGIGFVAVNTDPMQAVPEGAEAILLETRRLRGLGTGGDPLRGRALAEEHLPQLKALCEGVEVAVIVTGLGGGAGTGISPVLARAAKEAGALVVAFAMTPFDCEGGRRQKVAREGIEELKAAADGVICLPNQRICKLVDENTSILDTFKITNEFLAEGMRGFWRLLTQTGLIEIHLEDLYTLLRDRHAESAFAVAEAMGPNRSREVVEKLLVHPMLDDGRLLGESDAILVSIFGGPDLSMADVNRVMEQIERQCEHAQVVMGAAVQEDFRDRLAVTLIAARHQDAAARRTPPVEENLNARLVDAEPTARPHSRFVPPPPPTLPTEQVEALLARQGAPRQRLNPVKMSQGQLPLEIVSKGRFDKSEPTIHKGEDLDVPTYIRRGMALN